MMTEDAAPSSSGTWILVKLVYWLAVLAAAGFVYCLLAVTLFGVRIPW